MANTQPLFLVEAKFLSGIGFYEVDRELTRRGLLGNIATGEFEKVVRIIEIIESEGTCRDVTEDIAREVRDFLWNECQGEISPAMEEWLQARLDVMATRGMRVAA